MKNNLGIGKRITAFALAVILMATSTNYTVFADEQNVKTQQDAGSEITTYANVTFKNDGYPYGKDMTDSQITLVMDVEGSASSYQWKSAPSKEGEYTDINDATTATYTLSDLTAEKSGTWYKCIVDGKESKAIEIVYPGKDGRTWTKPYNSGDNWYISNGTMAYMANGTRFDVTGLYTKDNKQYMLCTSYGRCWDLYSSTDSEPTPKVFGSNTRASLDTLRVAFNEKDHYDIIFEADLADGQRAFSFGCDTQIGDASTSGSYSDKAALSAMTKNGKLKQVSMIGAAAINKAADTDPAFVIAPISDNSLFWIGKFNSRTAYAYNEMDSVSNGYRTKKIGEKNVVTSMEGLDSGMTMSWTNLESGSAVKFRFGVGDVKETGAVNGKVDYVKEKITGLEKSTTYTITVEGNDKTYTVTSDENGEIPLEGKDLNGNTYDFIGKTINVAKADNLDASADLDISGRPETPNNPSDLDNATGTDNKPEIDANIEITELTTNSVTISPKKGQQYAYSTDGENWIILEDANKDSSGNYVISGLNVGSIIYVRTRIAATYNEPTSEWSGTTSITLKDTIKAQINDYSGEYDGNKHGITVASVDNGAVIKYSLTADGVYDTVIPMKKDAGTYRVYYRVEKAGCYPSCGSASISISPKPIAIKWSNTVLKYDGTVKLPTAEIESGVLDDDIVKCQIYVRLLGSGNAIDVGTYSVCAEINDRNYEINSGNNTSYTIIKGNRNAPELTAVSETISGKKDGRIDGLTTEMEYCKAASAATGDSSDITVGDYTAVENEDMTFECGTYAVRYKGNDNYEVSAYTLVTINEGRKLTITLPADQKGYSIKCDHTQVSYGESVTLSISVKQGWGKAGDFDVMSNGTSLLNSAESADELTINNIVEDQIVTVTGIVDNTKPSGEIKIGKENSWKSFINGITFGLFYKERQQVTIEASDNESGVKRVEYYLYAPKTDKSELSIGDMESINDWTDLIDARQFYINPDAKYIIYVKITDNADNVTYISSNGIVLDSTAPEIKEITDGKSYCQDLEITVEDVNLKSVTYQVDGGEINEIVASSEKKYTIPVRTVVDDHGQKNIKIVATDNAGNTKAVNIKAAHEYNRTVVIAPSVLYEGCTLHTCTHDRNNVTCEKFYKDNILPAIGVKGLVPNNKSDLEYVIAKANEHLNDTDEELSDEDRAFYEEVLEAATKLHDNILKAEELIAEINAINNNIPHSDSVSSNDKRNISDVLTKIDALLDEENAETPTASLTEEQKEHLEKLKQDITNKQTIVDEVSASIIKIDSQVEDMNKIDDIQPDNQKSLEDILDNIENLLNKKSNLTSDELTKIEGYHKQMLEKIKEAAKKDIDNELEKTKKQIEATISDQTEKKATLESAEKIAQNTIESISKADSKASLCNTRDDGKIDLDLITKDVSDVKKSVSENIRRIYNDKVSNVNKMSDLTEEERSKALSELESNMNNALSKINEADTKDGAVEIFDDIKSKFNKIENESLNVDISNAKDKAKADVKEAASKVNDAISDMADLKEDEVAQAKANVKTAVDAAIAAIDAATDKARILAAKDEGLTAIDNQKAESAKTDLFNARTKAKEDIRNHADAIKKAIAEMPNLIEKEKKEADTTIEEIVSNANIEMDKITDTDKKMEVANLREDTYKLLEQIEVGAVKGDISNLKEAVKSDIDSKAEAAKDAIDKMEDLTPEQKSEAKADIDKKAEEVKKAVDDIKVPTGEDDVENVRKDIESKKTDAIDSFDKQRSELAIQELENVKDKAKSEIEKKADEIKKTIDAMPKLSDKEKEETKAEVDKKVKDAKSEIDKITDPAAKGEISKKKDEVEKVLDRIESDAANHKYGKPVFTWSKDYSTAEATFTCENDKTHIETVDAKVISETVAATCEAVGKTVYTATVEFEGKTYTDSKEVEIPALGHKYGESVFTWNDDYSAATATFTCENDKTHAETVKAAVTSETVAATCETAGKITYTASLEFNGKTYTDSKETEIKAIGHKYGTPVFTWSDDYSTAEATFTCANDKTHVKKVDAKITSETVDATCTTEGTITYTASVKLAGKTYTDTKVVNNKALGHKYGKPNFTWSKDYSTAEATFICENDKTHIETVKAAVTSETVDATCETAGKNVYTATAEFEGKTYTDSKEVGIPAIGHKYGKTVFTWSDDYSAATATFTCENDNAHVLVKECVVAAKSVEATCTKAGKTVYTATVEFEGKIYTDSKETEIKAIGHKYGTPVFTWSKDYSTAEATFTCENDKTHVKKVDAKITSETVDATCETAGKNVYTATVEFDGKTYTDSKETEIKAIGHKYGTPVFTWSKDYSTADATFTCANDKTHVKKVDAKITSETVDATCTTEGRVTYTASVIVEGKTYTDFKVVNGGALGHKYGEPEFTWSKDYSTAEATFTCENDKTHVETVEAAVTSETVDATCTTAGKTVYTVTAEFEGKTYTDSKKVGIPALGHKYGEPVFTWNADYSKATAEFTCANDKTHVKKVDAKITSETVDATCTTEGTITYTASVKLAGKTYTDTKVVNNKALGHKYGKPNFTWSKDYGTATATFTCENDNAHVLVKECVVAAKSVEATCTKAGKTVYTATVEFEGKIYTDSKETEIKAIGHKYGTPVFTWSKDYSTAEATFSCENDKTHVKKVDAKIISETVAATCETAGKTVYTATAEFEGKTYTDSKETEIKAIGHKYGTPVFTWTDDYSTAEATFTCENDKTHVETVKATVTSKATAATCTEAGKTVYTATAEFEGKIYTETKETDIPELGHSWSEWVNVGSQEKSTCSRCGQVKYRNIDADDTGKVEKDAEVAPNSPVEEAALDNKHDDLIAAKGILTPEDKAAIEGGASARIWIEVSATENLAEADEQKIKAKAINIMGNDISNVVYFNIDMFKSVTKDGVLKKSQITEPGTDIEISVSLPESLIQTDSTISRAYKIIRLHDGIVDSFDAEFDKETGTLKFVTDRFSTYAIAFTDTQLATNITLTPESAILTKKGETVQLIATVTPENTLDKKVIWSSSDSSVATVDANGLVTAVSNGTVIITATTEEGGKTATTKITVNIPSDSDSKNIDDNVGNNNNNSDGKANGKTNANASITEKNKNSNNQKLTSSKTGDSSDVTLWTTVFVLSLAGVVDLLARMKKYKR